MPSTQQRLGRSRDVVCSRAPSRPAQPTWLFSFQRRRRPAINSSNRIHGDVPPMQIPGAPTPRRNIGWVEQKFKAPKASGNPGLRKQGSGEREETHDEGDLDAYDYVNSLRSGARWWRNQGAFLCLWLRKASANESSYISMAKCKTAETPVIDGFV